MKARYKKSGNVIVEQRGEENTYEHNVDYYNPLRTIPCSENNWKDGQELEEGVDYTIILNGTIAGYAAYQLPFLYTAFPAVPIVQETEDELWNEVFDMFSESISNPFGSFEPLNVLIKSKFTIQRRK